MDMQGALEFIDKLIRSDQKGNYVFAINAEKIMAIQKDAFLKSMVENAALLLPDGVGIVLGAKWLYGLKVTRITGVELMLELCKEAELKGYKIFIYGAEEAVNKNSVEQLKLVYPSISIVGRCNGYISEEEMESLIKRINDSNADILFIALGSPKQEKWIQKYLPVLNTKICLGIGGTLDVISGKSKRAPENIQKLGLEWLYRLIKEPKRIRRQIIYPVFITKLALERFKIKKRMKNTR